MSWFSCPGTYDSQHFRCRWLCCAPWHERRKGQDDETEQQAEPEIVSERGNPMQLTCFGEYDDSIACSYCWRKTECFHLKHGVSSSSAFYPTGSSAVDTGATIAEGVSDMTAKDLATRKEKAQKLEVASVGNDFMIKSSTRQGGYMVNVKEEGGYYCACMDYATHRGDKEWKCKHIIAVELYLENRGPTNSDSRYDIIDIK